MGGATRTAQRLYMRRYRSRPLAAQVHAWESRTRHAAMRMLVRRHPAEYLGILDEVRRKDPKPEPVREEDSNAA